MNEFIVRKVDNGYVVRVGRDKEYVFQTLKNLLFWINKQLGDNESGSNEA